MNVSGLLKKIKEESAIGRRRSLSLRGKRGYGHSLISCGYSGGEENHIEGRKKGGRIKSSSVKVKRKKLSRKGDSRGDSSLRSPSKERLGKRWKAGKDVQENRNVKRKSS